MTSVALFYEQAAAISADKHKDWAVETGGNYAFARHTNAVPVTAVEFARAARDYPIVFSGQGDDILPLAVVGLRDRENLFIGERGEWAGDYVPAFVRRYPFIFATSDGGKNFTLCIDESFAGCNQEGRGARLFDDAGKRTSYVDGVLGFLKEYQRQYELTRLFTRRLREFDLLEPMQASVAMDSGEKMALSGFSVASRERMRALSGERLAALIKSDLLELAYLHLFSLANFASLVTRQADRQGSSQPAAAPKAPAGKPAPSSAAAGDPDEKPRAKKPAGAKPARRSESG